MSSTVGATAVGASATSSPTSTPTSTTDTNSGSNNGLSTGAKAGIGIGVGLGAAIVLAIGVLFALRRRKQRKEAQNQNHYLTTPHQTSENKYVYTGVPTPQAELAAQKGMNDVHEAPAVNYNRESVRHEAPDTSPMMGSSTISGTSPMTASSTMKGG